LQRGRGAGSARELRESLAELDAPAQRALALAGVRVGRVSVYVPSLLRRGALEQRATLVKVFEPELRLPVLGRSHYEARGVNASTWRSVGYVVLGARACRIDLVERAADALANGASETDAVGCLSVPRRDAPQIVRAIKLADSPSWSPKHGDAARAPSE
jgi:hypothetical protein